MLSSQSFLTRALLLGLLFAVPSCGPSFDPLHPPRTPLADRWFTRAKQSYKNGDFDDANEAAKSALQAAPSDPEIRTLNAKIALTKLDFAGALKLTEGLQTTEVHGLRGRAHWYAGDIEQAADELETMLQDPAVKDNWAHEIAKLARRGTGRHPFAMEGGLVAAVEMPRAGPALIVPCELEGESILALIATATGEVVLDSASRREAAWVNLRFGDRVEVKDVPALTQDLSGLSRQLGAPIKALLGVNLLRHMHVTFDRRGDQFVVRKEDPPTPPDASRVPLWYVRGGGMILRASVTSKEDGGTPLLVDTSALFPVALEDAIWKRAGVDLTTLRPEPGVPGMKSGTLPTLKLGAFDLPKVPAVEGAPMEDIRANVDVDVGGVVGSGLLYLFRVTLADEGRFMWIEPDPTMMQGSATLGSEPPPAPPLVPDGTPGPPKPAGSAPPRGGLPSPTGTPSKGTSPPSKGGAPPSIPQSSATPRGLAPAKGGGAQP
jgi:hypothetical protein